MSLGKELLSLLQRGFDPVPADSEIAVAAKPVGGHFPDRLWGQGNKGLQLRVKPGNLLKTSLDSLLRTEMPCANGLGQLGYRELVYRH